MNFRLVPNSVTLNDVERRNSPQAEIITTLAVSFSHSYKPFNLS